MRKKADPLAEARAEVARVLTPGLTHYEVLGVMPAECGGSGCLHNQHRHLAARCHPDRWAGATPDEARRAHDAMALINVAYNTLGDPSSQRLYLAQLRTTHRACLACKGEGATRKQKGFNAITLVPCKICAGSGHIKKRG